jgi:hypothetical protein
LFLLFVCEIETESIHDLLVEPTPSIPAVAPAAAAADGKPGAKRTVRSKRAAKSAAIAAASVAAPAPAPLAPMAAVKLQSSSKGDETSIVNLREVEIANHREAFALLQQGQSNRSMHETALNADSSRSHSVFTLKLVTPAGAVWSRLSVVDLAGSERTNRVAHHAAGGPVAAAAAGGRMKETVNINQSLLVLGRCLEALKYNQSRPRKLKIVPFRESQITRLFKDSLLGWGSTVMLTNVSQNPLDYDETIHALKYAAVAKEIRVVARVDTKRPAGMRTPATTERGHHKRAPSQPLQELDELEHATAALTARERASARRDTAGAARRRSVWDADDNTTGADGNPSYDSLLEECFTLRARVVELELAVSNAEIDARNELAEQHETALAEMEAGFMEQMEKDRKKAEEKAKKMFELWKMEFEMAKAEEAAAAAERAKENAIRVSMTAQPLLKGVVQLSVAQQAPRAKLLGATALR